MTATVQPPAGERAIGVGSTDAPREQARFPVMVLAHNEERHIGACLDSIFAADPALDFDVYVMANGCTDRTEAIVADYARARPQVHLVSIALGDKCNAWNVFIHDTVPAQAPMREAYFFMDGDARATPGSFSVMLDALRAQPQAHAASAVPGSGRNRTRDAREIVEQHGLVANLYALRGTFVERLRTMGVHIPLALEGDDGLVGALVKWDLDPRSARFDDARIAPCADARFEFEPMSLTRPADWRVYWKRAVRYGRRRYEFQLLGARLKSQGIAGLPRTITELYADAASLKLRWDGVYTVPNWFALRAMRRGGR
ncbi:MAG TPA: glycosyltransferase family A protein [Casimicrobiaceae bacterium]|jgi:glycosyltransferase involved in cell wall biosynthesis|nr:glycosyltransferase family A protein [Casimicrobiaceae bacterium]